MTEITIFVHNEAYVGFIANQHAGEGDPIGEMVCHGVSALTLTCAMSLSQIATISEEEMSAEQAEAYLSLRIPYDLVDETTEILFRSMIVGLRAIESEYDQYLKIETQEV